MSFYPSTKALAINTADIDTMIIVIDCIDLTGTEPCRQLGVGRVIVPGSLGGLMTSQFTVQPVFLHCVPFSTARWDLLHSRTLYFQMLFLSRPFCVCLIFFPVPLYVGRWLWPELSEWDSRSSHCNLCLLTIAKRLSCGKIACWIFTWTSSVVRWSLYEMSIILLGSSKYETE